MIKPALLYSVALAAFAFFLDWLEYRYMMRAFSAEVFIVLIALVFTTFGAWAAWKLTSATPPQSKLSTGNQTLSSASTPLDQHNASHSPIRLTPREDEVLQLLAQGHTNKEMARALGLAPDTVKTHLSNIYRKLKVKRRTQAIRLAQSVLRTS